MSHRYSFLFLLSLLAQLTCSASAQVGPPTILTTSLSQPTAKVGTELDVVVQAEIQLHWHLYATDFSDEVGPVVFILTFAKSPAYELVGKPQSIGSKHVPDEVFNGEVAFFREHRPDSPAHPGAQARPAHHQSRGGVPKLLRCRWPLRAGQHFAHFRPAECGRRCAGPGQTYSFNFGPHPGRRAEAGFGAPAAGFTCHSRALVRFSTMKR
ncbi:hypothetical protein [Hymenobacter terrenus]|uniref:hypothetical protein n=1 Tax=Hymenobacter terrenus TaxID=1629124 RepID=UPI000619A92E|nr:hypothetical protein [Hymenobacter terrenus]